MEQEPDLDLSIVIPVYNERDNLRDLYLELNHVLSDMDVSYEILLVDDGSTDGSLEVLSELSLEDSHLKIISFRRNFGQTSAMAAGFDHAKGRVVVTMDADRQNNPADIPALLERLDQGYDIVSGRRANRQDKTITRKLPSFLANQLISFMTGVHLKDYGCTLKAYRLEVVKGLRLYGEMHRFIPALASHMGVRVAEMDCSHRPRTRGASKYGLTRTVRVFLDLLTVKFLLSYSTRPLQIFGLVGLGCSGIGVFTLLILTSQKILLNQSIGGRPLLLLGVLLAFLGVQFITMGLLAELIIRTYHESQQKPIYVIRSIISNRKEDR